MDHGHTEFGSPADLFPRRRREVLDAVPRIGPTRLGGRARQRLQPLLDRPGAEAVDRHLHALSRGAHRQTIGLVLRIVRTPDVVFAAVRVHVNPGVRWEHRVHEHLHRAAKQAIRNGNVRNTLARDLLGSRKEPRPRTHLVQCDR